MNKNMISNLKQGFFGFFKAKTDEDRTHRAVVLGFLVLPVLGTVIFIIYAFLMMGE